MNTINNKNWDDIECYSGAKAYNEPDFPNIAKRRAYGFRNFENYRLSVKVLCS